MTVDTERRGDTGTSSTPDRSAPAGIETQDDCGYRRSVAAAIADGATFAGLHVGGDRTSVRVLLIAPDGEPQWVQAPVKDEAVPSIVDLVPAAAWDEREAFDRFAVDFTGHRPMRPLLDHRDHDGWTVTVDGSDTHQVAVGPIHAGVIESGHFRFHLVGDRILALDARLFYKHRGLERAAEGASLTRGAGYVARACAACSVANDVAYAHAYEQVLGLVTPPELARIRTVLLELERLWSHLNDIAAICAGVGLAAGNTRFAAFTEQARHLNATFAGHRFLFGAVRPGGSDLNLAADHVTGVRQQLAALRVAVERSWRELVFNASFTDRLCDVGIVTADQARSLGTVGPAARACGLATDVRALPDPRLAYDGFQAVVPDRATGDVQARFEQRILELRQTFDLLASLLDGPVLPSAAEPGQPRGQTGHGRVESPRGATTCILEYDDLTITRLRLRTGSFANWPSVAHAAGGNLLPDFPLINKSFELCYACADR